MGVRAAVLAALAAAAVTGGASAAVPAGTLYYAGKPFGHGTSYDIYAVAAGGGAPTRITSSPQDEFEPAVSGDGARIAYTVCQAACSPYIPGPSGTGAKAAIFVAHADGSGARRLTPWQLGVGHATWSPDGSKVAYQAEGRPLGTGSHIWVIRADGTGSARLTGLSQQYDYEPAWSPDGARIAFVRSESIAVLELSTGAISVPVPAVRSGDRAIASPAWSPDGSQIAFSYLNGLAAIYRVHADGTGLVQVFNGSGQSLYPAWSPDGSQIAFVHCLRLCRGTTASIAGVPATGGDPSPLLPGSPDFRGWLAWH